MNDSTFRFTGSALKMGANVDTDAIIPARYLNLTDPDDLAAHCMEEEFPEFREQVRRSPIVVAGKNFGCGSSREHAPIAMAGSGVSCVIAHSFARLFFRNAINIGLPVMELDQAEEIAQGDMLEVDFTKGIVFDRTTEKRYVAAPLPEFMQGLLRGGGILSYLEKKIEEM
jgi:3-isopropylmalate/(R)-2-methylmalate dehydratase small subunit